jgi:hypothetical protein
VATVPDGPGQQEDDQKNDKERGGIHDQAPGCEIAPFYTTDIPARFPLFIRLTTGRFC